MVFLSCTRSVYNVKGVYPLRRNMRYLLNAPVLTGYGTYSLEGPLSLADAREFVRTGVISAIGHTATAAALSRCLEMPVPVQRRAISMQSGDEALVFRLRGRLPEGNILDSVEIDCAGFELALLRRRS